MAYTTTNWENLPSTNTPINETNLNKIENGVYTANDKKIITVGLTSNVTLATTGESDIRLNSVKGQVGSGLNLSNGVVNIGAGISTILISAAVYTNRSSAAGAACNFSIRKNGNTVASSINSVPTGAGNQTINIPSVLLYVQEGDTIGLVCYGYSGDVISSAVGTHLTIQVVD